MAALGLISYHEKKRSKRRILAAVTVAITVGTFSVILFPLPAHARTVSGPSHSYGPPWSATRIDSRVTDTGPSDSHDSKRIVETEVCFTVHVIGDPRPQQVSGTLFHDRKRNLAEGTALLLQHGSVATRSAWDGERPHVTGVPSMARPLAAAGYDVFAIDRLGYGRSPYERGSGWALTMDSYVAMTREMVTQIREGTFRVGSNDSCDGGAKAEREADNVVLMGFSGGAGLTQYYATKHHDIAGIVSLMWSSQGSSNKFGEYFNSVVVPQLAQGKDYVYLFDVEANGYSQSCDDFLFYDDGVKKKTIEQLCGEKGFGGDQPELMPSGDISTQLSMMQQIKLTIGNVGPTPALLVFADADAIFTSEKFGEGEPDTITPEKEMWKKCNCDVEFLWQENSGHAGWLHDSSPEVSDEVLDWLDSRDAS